MPAARKGWYGGRGYTLGGIIPPQVLKPWLYRLLVESTGPPV